MAKKQKVRLTDLSGLIGFGENPKGFVAQTSNGTERQNGTAWDGDRWGHDQRKERRGNPIRRGDSIIDWDE